MILKGKKILLGVTGSIAAYKACDVAREFIKAGASVKIVMSEASKRFVSPLTFEALTREGVLHEGTESWANELNHIDITKWADVFVIAPASANTINKLSKGIADNLLLQCALAFDKPILIAPAANTKMLENHQTKNSIKMLEVSDMTIIKSQNKLLACGDEGNGALADPKEIYYQTLKVLLKDDFWRDRRVVVTSGGTIEKIDDVRFISNFSSGKMGHAIATALYLLGADVCLITTKETKDIPSEIYTIDVEDAKEMQGYLTDAIRVAKKGVMSKPSINHPDSIGIIQKEPYLFMVAAVADYRAKYPQTGKMKKDTTTKELAIEFELNDDILSSLDKQGIKAVGFKAEMDAKSGLKNAKEALKAKGLDAICYNLLEDSSSFGSDENAITFITNESEIDFGKKEKLLLAFDILQEARKLGD